MSGILSGLESFGLGNLENMSLYESPEEKKARERKAAEASRPPVVEEQDLLFDKSYTCPVCDKEFKAKTVRIGRARLTGSDLDLRPKYENIDMLKYDVIMCPHCGYAALSRYFKFLTSPQMKLIKLNISQAFKPRTEEKEFYTYEDALERYKLTLVNAIVKRAKPSEKAYICLKSAWLLRGMGEALEESAQDYAQKKEECTKQEDEYLRNALEGFLAARQTESFPMCGMDEATVDYLIAATAMRFGQFDVATKLVSSIILSKATNPRMKNKALTLKETLLEKIKEK